jgi:DNA-binding NtrC family response regulator
MDSLDRLLIGQSPAMHRLRADIVRYGALRLPVLIEGPTGSGKELVARGLHLASRRSGALVAFNVCAVPDTMFEDAMFGHVRGAFTGASSDSDGYLAEANGGSVVLDEINGLSQTSQAKLLRALETGEFRPVGARRDRRSDFRLLSTSNVELAGAMNAGQFRPDLYFRLSGLTLTVPPLRQRVSDLPELLQHFLADYGDNEHQVEPSAIEALADHTWPGNVRELRHVVARALSMADRRPLDAESILGAITHQDATSSPTRAADERAELVALLSRYRWDTERVAKDLGVHRATVYRRMQRHGLTNGPGVPVTIS